MPGAIIIGQGGGSGGGSGSNASVGLTGTTAPTSATELGIIISGVFRPVSDTYPLPVDGTITATNPSVGVIGSTAPLSATFLGVVNGSGNLEGVGASNPVRVDPTGTTVQPVSGGLTNNNAAPSTNNIGALVALANAATPTNTEGDQTLLSVDLAGNIRAILHAETTKVIGTVNQGTSPWIISGAVTTSGTVTAIGTLTNNNAAPTSTNLGVLPAIANAAAPTFTEGDQVLVSVDLAGALRANNAEWGGTVVSAPPDSTGAPAFVGGGPSNTSLVTWNSSSGTLNTTQAIISGSNHYATLILQVVTTVISGSWTLQGSADGSNWSTIPGFINRNGATAGIAAALISLNASTTTAYVFSVGGYPWLRILITGAFSGGGSAIYSYGLLSASFTVPVFNPSVFAAGVTAETEPCTALSPNNSLTNGNAALTVMCAAQTTGPGNNSAAMLRTPAIFKTAQFSASGLTPVWTPVSGKKFRVMRFMISIPDNSSTSGGGVVTVSLFDAGTITSSTFTTFSITSNVLTINGTFSGFVAGQNIILTGFTATYLNNITLTLTTASASVLTAAFTHANVGSTGDTTGTAIAGIITAFDVYLPATSVAAPIGDGFQTGWVDLGNGYISTTANNPLAINLSAAIATANARISVCGTEE